jgi:formate hydrogenlyase subunit 3/multisubunit Na+/H+ antiporter MnhD subunit
MKTTRRSSQTPTLASVVTAALFFSAGTVVCVAILLKAVGDQDYLWVALMAVGAACGAFMAVVSAFAIRNVRRMNETK